jgi:hypothetical protein
MDLRQIGKDLLGRAHAPALLLRDDLSKEYYVILRTPHLSPNTMAATRPPASAGQVRD